MIGARLTLQRCIYLINALDCPGSRNSSESLEMKSAVNGSCRFDSHKGAHNFYHRRRDDGSRSGRIPDQFRRIEFIARIVSFYEAIFNIIVRVDIDAASTMATPLDLAPNFLFSEAVT